MQLMRWLWLSNHESVENAKNMLDMDVTDVLSTNAMSESTRSSLQLRLKRVAIRHHYVKGQDEEGYDMIGKHWEECLAILRRVRESGGRIVVHCVAGANRSGLIACAALMVLEQRPVLEVVHTVKQKRGYLLTNESFRRQLCELAAAEGLLGPKPEGYSDEPLKKK